MLQSRNWAWLRTWEALLALILLLVVTYNISQSESYLKVANLVNVFHLSIEKVVVVLAMTYIIINGEIDLSVASIMGLAGCLFAWLYKDKDVPLELAFLITLGAGVVCGLFNGFWVAYIGLPSLAVTLATSIGFRGAARVLLEDASIGNFPQWFDDLGQQNLIGPFPAALFIFAILFVIFAVILHFTAFGRYVYIIGNNREAARFSGVNVRGVKLALFAISGFISALAGVMYVARLGTVRANLAENFELDIITMVLLGGVSIFGGRGTIVGVGLSILVVLNLRNGLQLAGITGIPQTGYVGLLLILSVLIPNMAQFVQSYLRRNPIVKVRDKEETAAPA